MRFTTLIALTTLLLAGCAAKRAETTEMKYAPPSRDRVEEPRVVKVSAEAPPTTAPLPTFQGATIHFEFDQSVLRSDGVEALQRLADAMRANSSLHVRIEGHSDERGTTEYNLALGSKRAEVAKKYLVALGVDESRVSTVTFGEERPAIDAQTDEAYAANRRDVINAQ